MEAEERSFNLCDGVPGLQQGFQRKITDEIQTAESAREEACIEAVCPNYCAVGIEPFLNNGRWFHHPAGAAPGWDSCPAGPIHEMRRERGHK